MLPSESFMSSYLDSTNRSRTASSTEKCQDAMDILEQYGISRPSGWFSDGDAGTPDQIKQTKSMFSQICHSCGNPLAFERYCSHCGHDSCMKCTGETPGQPLGHRILNSSIQYQEHSFIDKIPELPTQSEYPESERTRTTRTTVDTAHRRKLSRFASEPDTPKTSLRTKAQSRQRPKPDHNTLKPTRKKTIAAPTEISSSVKNNPFFVADRGMKKEAPEPEITTRSVQVERKPRPSDCVPNRLKSSSPRVSHIEEQCSDPGCRATHDGHHPTRHSIGCATRRSLGAQVVESNDLDIIDTNEHDPREKKHTQSLRDSPSRSKLQMKIDQLYHHGQDLHHSQHIMEHLSAGVQTLESSTDEKLTNGQDGRMRADGYGLRVQSQPGIDHSLSRDETVTVAKDTIEHNLNKEPAVPDEIEPQPPNLTNYHKGDRHPSPKSHEPHDDTQPKDAHWIKHPINNNKTHDAPRDYTGTLNSQTASEKPVSQSKGPKKGLDTSTEANERIAPQAQNKSLSEKGHDADLNSKKRIGKVDEPVLESKMMLKSAPRINNDTGRPKAEATEQPRSQQLTPSHVENWRRELSSVNSRTPLHEKDWKDSCFNCNPTQSSSPKQTEGGFQIFVEDESHNKTENELSAAFESPMPRLKVTDIEHSLARKSVEQLLAKSPQPQEIAAQEPKSTRPPSITEDRSRNDSEMSTLIYDPRPSQVDELGLESGRPSPAKQAQGVCSHPNGDVDIEGLTVVMHLRGKDDLVINTDLKDGLQEHMRPR
ncbi:uncharacterized protein FPRO_05117 [Fusarium proliferatum ET1]|uniref:Uncharacterized protein n=1 Tax=Fusarium proliferatum (strain ET1) TaxID=1227346 RepID=A0A1L7VHZ6_FUSPR|nr:uncharacterized protein FPRO_05117 [Fusarium proliferatum ET1]CZR40217.1 uncharacterized protein FPRO_05117 [Fusarium proliferatum ET1]